MVLRVRDLMPMFTVTNGIDRSLVDYHKLWQRKNLLLISLRQDDPTARAYVESLIAKESDLRAYDTAFIVTTDAVPGIPSPGIVVADRWGEIYYVQEASSAADLADPVSLIEWLRYVQSECPECQGETR
jgi:hypothetical protein